jgi:hypothetical protein
MNGASITLISTTKKATYSAPRRNIVVTMRADSPKSRPYALRSMPRILALGLLLTAALAAPAQAAELPVVVVPPEAFGELEPLAGKGAIGLLVPDAGPETSRARALAALQRGAVRNSLLGGRPAGKALVEVTVAERLPEVPAIVLTLPEGGLRSNDVRYDIAVLAPGYRGLLTSESTRIPGLVSIVDVAPTALGSEGKLGSTPHHDPAAAVAELDRRIREHRDAKTPILLASLALILVLATFRRAAVLPAFAAILLANVALGITGWTNPWIDVLVVVFFAAASLLFARLPLVAHGFLLAGVLLVYLAAMGIDERWVALSPLGPTQNARFYGLSNLLATLLLVPALAGAAILGRAFGMWAFGAVAALALVTVGGSQFGADGGGVLVLLAGYAVFVVAQYGLTRRTLVAAAAVVAILAIALVAGGDSHVTDALRDGPTGLAEDFWRRLRLSWLRATSGWGVGLLVGGGIAALAIPARRERRPLLLAYLVAIAVSLIVNDSPNDVIVAGLAGYLVLSTAPGVARPADEPARPAARESRAQSVPAASP